MKFIQFIVFIHGFAGLVQSHMEMIYPPPFKSKVNPYSNNDIDYNMKSPLKASGADFPCKGYQSLVGTDMGKSTASFKAGEKCNMTITGSVDHGGGSCQASISLDKGSTWQVIHSYIGNCPTAGTSSYDFTIPGDTPPGEAIFAWTWFNKMGKREMYMNCAVVDILSGSSTEHTVAFNDRPGMFVANVNNGCSTKEGSDLTFPNPGNDASNDSTNTSPPICSCLGDSGTISGCSTSFSASNHATFTDGIPVSSTYVSSSFLIISWCLIYLLLAPVVCLLRFLSIPKALPLPL